MIGPRQGAFLFSERGELVRPSAGNKKAKGAQRPGNHFG
jgi:hypothetical protein